VKFERRCLSARNNINKLADLVQGKELDEPLAFVSREAASSFDKDLERAGIPKWAPGGKVDFHAL